MKRVTLPCAGLATDPNPLLTAAQGGMRRADDVVVISDGAVMPRPGFGAATEKSGTQYEPRALTVFGGTPVITSTDGSAWRIETDTDVLTGDAEPPDPTQSPTQFAQARQSLYYTTIDGIKKLVAPDSTSTGDAGLEMLVSTIGPLDTTVASGPFSTAGQFAFRLVFKRTDANGYVVRSAPSPKLIVFAQNTPYYLDWSQAFSRVSIPSWLVAGDQIEVYRSRKSADVSTPPSSELYLQQTYTITSTNVSNGYCVLADDYTVDDALGAALYTNPSQQGIAASKATPPRAVALGYWSSCMWFGNTVEPNRVELRITDVAANLTTATHGLTYVANTAATYTAGSPNITNVTTVTNAVVGMAITDGVSLSPAVAGTYVPANTYIGSISGAGPYTVAMVNAAGNPVNALASGINQVARFHDIIEVDGVEFYAASQQYLPGYVLSSERGFAVNLSATLDERLVYTAEALALAVNMYATKNPSFTIRAYNLGDLANPIGSYSPGSVLFEEIGVAGTSFTVQCTTKPTVVNPTTASALTSSSDTSPARLFWSDPDEPEAVPTVQFVDVGNQRDPILALVPLRAALLIFKRDGIYRLTGSAPDSWAVELLDGSTRLLNGSCVDVLDDRAYAFTNRGAVIVDEGGTQNISERRIGRSLLEAQRIVTDNANNAFVRAWAQSGLVTFGIPESGDNAEVSFWFVYRPVTGSWTKWTIEALCAAQDFRSTSFYYARPNMWELRSSTYALESVGSSGYDRAYSLSGWTYTSATPSVTVTAAQRGTWVPKACDWVSATTDDVVEYREIVSVEESGTDYVCTLSSAFTDAPTANRVAYETIVPVMHWQAHSVDPINAALYQEIQLLMSFGEDEIASSTGPAITFDVGATTDRAGTAQTIATSTSRASITPPSTLVRVTTPRDAARATHLYPYVTGCNVKLPWVCLGIGLVFEPTSERTAR
jgi:hypothetical protein